MRVILRTPHESDWTAIFEVANVSAPWSDNREWFERRKHFTGFPRCPYVAEDVEAQRVIGYGAIEGEETVGKFRIFAVMSPNLLSDGGEQMYERLDADLLDLNAKVIWAREVSRDTLIKTWSSRKAPISLPRHRNRSDGKNAA